MYSGSPVRQLTRQQQLQTTRNKEGKTDHIYSLHDALQQKYQNQLQQFKAAQQRTQTLQNKQQIQAPQNPVVHRGREGREFCVSAKNSPKFFDLKAKARHNNFMDVMTAGNSILFPQKQQQTLQDFSVKKNSTDNIPRKNYHFQKYKSGHEPKVTQNPLLNNVLSVSPKKIGTSRKHYANLKINTNSLDNSFECSSKQQITSSQTSRNVKGGKIHNILGLLGKNRINSAQHSSDILRKIQENYQRAMSQRVYQKTLGEFERYDNKTSQTTRAKKPQRQQISQNQSRNIKINTSDINIDLKHLHLKCGQPPVFNKKFTRFSMEEKNRLSVLLEILEQQKKL